MKIDETEVAETETEGTEAGLTMKPESVEDTIRKSIEELKAKDTEDAEPEVKPDVPVQAEEVPEKKGKKGKKVVEITPEEDIPTPQRFLAENKEWFESQPVQAKKELARMIKDQEADYTKKTQDLQREQAQVSDIRKTVDFYLPQWNLKGVPNAAVAVAELCAANDKLLKDPIGGLDELIQRMGLTPETYLQHSQNKRKNPGQAPQYQPQAQNNQQPKYLTESDFRTILDKEQKINSVTSELTAVRDEKDSNGKFKHPRLHDDGIWGVFEPLIKARMATHPDETYTVATKAVYANVYGTNGSPSQTQQRLPDDKLAKAKAAAQSIKGRGGKFDADEEDEVPGDLEGAIRYSIEQLRG